MYSHINVPFVKWYSLQIELSCYGRTNLVSPILSTDSEPSLGIGGEGGTCEFITTTSFLFLNVDLCF